jgi:hypothetical protein
MDSLRQRTPILSLAVAFLVLTIPAPLAGYVTENVFLVSIDGIRDHEAFAYQFQPGENEHPYMPFIWNALKPQGTSFMEMYNVFCTFTSPGHATMLTGAWQMFPNYATGIELFQTRAWEPTVFEYARKQLGLPQSETWCVVGKKNCLETNWSIHPEFGQSYGANLVRAPDGAVTMDSDSLTVDAVMGVLDADSPSLLFVNLQAVDALGHYGDYNLYLEAIQRADRAVERIWERIQADPAYAGKTTLIVTTDHGRHDPGKGDFMNHGGICHGCQHVMCLVVGPDTPSGIEVSRMTYQVDIAPTISEFFGVDAIYAEGHVLREAIDGYREADRLLMRKPASDIYDGMVFVVWSDNSSGVNEIYLVASYDNGASFGDTVQLSMSGTAAIQPDVSIDADGVHVVWLDFREGIWQLFYRKSEDFGTSWQPEAVLATNIMEDVNGENSAMMWEPFIVLERGGGMIAVSAQPVTIGALLSFDGGDTWEFELIDNAGYFPVGVNGCRLGSYAAVTWCDEAWSWSGSRNWEVFFKRSNELGFDWLTWRRLSWNTSYSIQPNIDSNGNMRTGVAWADNASGVFQIFFRRSTNKGLTWTSASTITSSPAGAWQPDLAWDRPSGDVHLVWTDYRDGHGELYYSLYHGTSWSAAERLTVTNGTVNQPDFAIDDVGNSFLVWEEVTASGSSVQMGPISNP